MRRKGLSKLRGTALIETVVAGFAVAVGLLAVAGSLGPSQRTSDSAFEGTAASQAAATLLDEVRGADFLTLEATYGGVTRPLAGAIPHASSVPTATFTVADEPGGGSARWPVRRVTVEIRWETVRGAQSARFATLVSDRTAAATGGS